MNTEQDNLVSLDQWKNHKTDFKRDNSFSDYLKVLSFHDLMNESAEIMNQLKHDDEDLFTKTRSIMNEFTVRLERESRHLADSVKELKKQIEDKLH